MLGLGLALSIVDTYWYLVGQGIVAASHPALFYAGLMLPPSVVFAISWRKQGLSPTAVADFVKRRGSAIISCTIAGFVVCLGGFALMCYAAPQETFEALGWALTFVLGCSNAAIFLLWYAMLSRLKGLAILLAACLSLFVAGLVQLCLAFCYSEFIFVLLLGLPILSFFSFLAVARIQRRPWYEEDNRDFMEPVTASQRRRGGIMLVSILLYSFAFFSLSGTLDSSGDERLSYTLSFASIAAGVLLASLLAYWLMRNTSTRGHLAESRGVIIPFLMIALYLLAYLMHGLGSVSNVVLYAGKKLTLFFAMTLSVTHRNPRDRLAAFAAALAVMCVAWFASWSLSLLLEIAPGQMSLTMPVLAVCAIVAAVVLEVARRGKRSSCPQDAGEAPSDARDRLFSQISEERGLTARESEVLPYLAAGLSSERIGEKLCVSSATVRTHASHIYQKLGVSSQSELVELFL